LCLTTVSQQPSKKNIISLRQAIQGYQSQYR
jgi:hypothetical protein